MTLHFGNQFCHCMANGPNTALECINEALEAIIQSRRDDLVNEVEFLGPFLLVRGWGLETRLGIIYKPQETEVKLKKGKEVHGNKCGSHSEKPFSTMEKAILLHKKKFLS